MLLVALLDYFAGSEVRIFPLYFLPIAWAAIRGSQRLSFGIALGSSVAWIAASALNGVNWHPLLFVFNGLMQSSSFLLVAALLGRVNARWESEYELSRTDSLTGLPNTRAFYDVAELLMASARRSRGVVTLVMFDLDNFKLLNDREGHLEGDRALRLVAETIRGHLRQSDAAARLGGDEFVALFPNTDAQGARVVLERVRSGVDAQMKAQGWSVSVSIGAVAFKTIPSGLDEALRRVDEVMYGAKRQGKNRVCVEAVT
jgi:diguanylate cyclase (GGDEF)-like protein